MALANLLRRLASAPALVASIRRRLGVWACDTSTAVNELVAPTPHQGTTARSRKKKEPNQTKPNQVYPTKMLARAKYEMTLSLVSSLLRIQCFGLSATPFGA